MKKLLTLVIAGGMLAFYACGPSKAELAKREKAKQDSIKMADSLAGAAAAAKQKAMQDSTDAANKAAMDAAKAKAMQDSIDAAASKKGGKKEPKAPKASKAGAGGRPGATKK